MAADSDGEADFVSYGTPLEPLEEDEPLKKPIPLHEQTVKDEKGRYRFHGAFTGGFSAGYFNTVGTKEGWAPSTFVSTRQQKAEKHEARPEDFMDEEDFSEHGIAPRQITTSHEFSSGRRDEVREKARAVSAQAALIAGDTLLEELISPARLSIGVELLRRMGWKEGQGVGPRVKRKARRQQSDGGRVFGCAPRPGSEESEHDDEDDDEFAPENVTFAPKDATPVDFTPKVGVQGLGYRGLDPGLALLGRGGPEHIDLFNPQSDARSQLFGDQPRGGRRGGVAGEAFGVGALEDDDDEEVYHRDSMSRYDTILGGEEPGDGLYGWTAPQQYTNKRGKNRDGSYLGKILEGFTLASGTGEEKTVFPPPRLPTDYRPVRRFHPVVLASLSGASPALAAALRSSRGHMVKAEPEQGGRHQLDSGQRRTLLGEDALQGSGSVLDLLRPADRNRLLHIRNSTQAPAQDSHDALLPAKAAAGLQQEALAAWKGVQTSSQTFKPFDKTPSKQARYEAYLDRLRQGDTDALERSLDPGLTEWERSREREEFVRASVLYRPSSSCLSSRFTSARVQEDDQQVALQPEEQGNEDDKRDAVKMRMFGRMTRETIQWHPDKLLCKRFNVPDPFPGSGMVGVPKVKRDKFSIFNFLTVGDSRDASALLKPPEPDKKSRWDVSEQKKKDLGGDQNQKDPKQPAAAALPSSPSSSSTAPPAGSRSEEEQKPGKEKKPGKEEEEEEQEEEESRPPMDLFRAIFAGSSDEKSSSSSEGESDDEEDGDDTKEEGPQLFSIPSVTSSTTTTSSVSAPSTSVSAPSTSVSAPSTSVSAPSTSVSAPSSTPIPPQNSTPRQQEEEEFGPKLPPPSVAPPSTARGGATTTSLEEKRSKTKEKKHKNKKHNKHKKEKKKTKKSKHKKKSRKDDDVWVSTEELHQRLKTIQSHQR
ncbi:G patch domain-containing protein 1 isoform X2 [Antennarius striatus]|uniref:G patch domain-containing protein 1 isoform X2 n=1 Tax=Antennarius striatus TaxID=241820 RepID=UPI0035AEC1F1